MTDALLKSGQRQPIEPTIGIDGFNLALDQGTGVATYARNLSFRLRDLGFGVSVLYGNRASPAANPLIREIAFFDSRVGEPPKISRTIRRFTRAVTAPLGEWAYQVPLSGQVVSDVFRDKLPFYDEIWNVQNLFDQAQTFFKLTGYPLRVHMRHRPKLMHWTYPVPAKVAGALNIYTLHDLVPLRLPYTTLDNKRRYFAMVRHIAKHADHIVTVSETSRSDIINLLGVSPDRVTNTYQSVELPKRYSEKPLPVVIEEIKGSFGLDYKNYWLFFGAIEPKKNVGRMIEAYLASGVEAPLVLVGRKAWKSEEELRLLYDDHIRYVQQDGSLLINKRRIILLDYAPFRLLVSLIRGAKGVLFPSLYEGFGLPVLEAMSLGTPVITTNTSSIPEVVGDSAITVDPYNTAELVEAIRAVDADAELRQALAVAGPERAALFGPKQYEQRLAAMYARLGVHRALQPQPSSATEFASAHFNPVR